MIPVNLRVDARMSVPSLLSSRLIEPACRKKSPGIGRRIKREAVLTHLDSEDASDALEEIDPNVQREILSTMDTETASTLIGLMTPAQAADVIPRASREQRTGKPPRRELPAALSRGGSILIVYSSDPG
jgi:hypothetical protein